MFTASVLSAIGLIHAYDLTEAGVQGRFIFTTVDDKLILLAAPAFTIMYSLGAVFLLIMNHVYASPGIKPASENISI